MENPKFLQINSLGSADKKNQAISAGFNDFMKQHGVGLISTADSMKRDDGTWGSSRTTDLNTGATTNNITGEPVVGKMTGKVPEGFEFSDAFNFDWNNTPNNPIIQGFQGMFNNPKFMDSPDIQNKLFDIDNLVKGQSGIFRTMQEGLTSFGADIDGKPLYAFNSLANDQSYDLGKNRLYTAGSIMQQFGAFQDEEDADMFAKFTANSGDPEFMGAIAGLSASGDKKGAVNLMMKEFGYADLDNLDSSEDKEKAYGAAFAAYNYVENVEKMSPAQQSLSLSTLGMMSYKFKDGTTMKDKSLVKTPDGKTAFTLGEAFALAGTGADVFSMQKNWDQLDAFQKITYGTGSPSQLAATGKRMFLLGDPSMEGAAVYQSEAELGRAGFTSVPSAGMGAITGQGDALPENYEVIGAGERPGQVIAVPKGLSYSASTINGTAEIRSVNDASGVKKASIGAFQTHARWLPNTSQNNLRGTSFANGIGQSGVLKDPYVMSAMVGTSVYGNVLSKTKVTEKDVAALRRQAENQMANTVTGGVSGQVQKLDQQLTGGKLEELRQASEKLNPMTAFNDKLGAKALNTVMKFSSGLGGGKSESQQGRDAVRKLGTESGLIDKNTWTVTLSDGTTADVGKDGHAAGHKFTDESKIMGENRELHPYDLDYTNDLDFASSMMTNALVRMMAGGKGTPIDHVGNQLANAALGKVGFNQEMTEDNFNYVRDNVRGFFFKQGIKTKEDAFALSNQMFAEGRLTEMDTIAMQQGINITFDGNGFDTASSLAVGRWKGLEVAKDLPASPGPNYDVSKPSTKFPSGEQIEGVDTEEIAPDIEQPPDAELQMNAGTYGGNANTDVFAKSIVKYKDPWSMRNGL